MRRPRVFLFFPVCGILKKSVKRMKKKKEVWLILMSLSMSSELFKERLTELLLQLRMTLNLQSWENPSQQTHEGSHNVLLSPKWEN